MIYILINSIVIISIGWLVYRIVRPQLSNGIFWCAFALKMGAGCALGILYMYYYGGAGDTINYHHTATVLANTARTNWAMFIDIFFNNPLPGFESQPRAWLVVQLTTVFHLLTGNNYWLTSCWYSLFSFVGLYYFVSTCSRIWPERKNAAVIAFLFFPSIVFWSSGIIKESIAMGCSGFALAFLFQFLYQKKLIVNLLIALFFLFLLWQVKYYIAAVWLLVLTPYALSFLPAFKKKGLWLLGLIVVLILIFISLVHPNFYPHRFIEVVFSNYQAYHHISGPGEAITYPYQQPDILFFIINSPIAFFSTLFLPLWPEMHAVPLWLAAIENWFLLSLFTGWMISKSKNGLKLNKLEIMVLFYCIILAVFLGLSAPNFGTLSRFRVSFLPFFVWLILVDNYFLVKFKIGLEQKNIWIRNR